VGRTTNFMIVSIFVLSGLYGSNVYGDNSDDGEKAVKTQLESITVTAQKIEEDPQEVPISMDIFSDIQIEDNRIENTSELVRYSPNVFMQTNPFENQIVIRGVSFLPSSIYAPAGYYVDGVAYSLNWMQNNEFFDIERVEVLKGPQGTLYGRNAESGVINIVTRKPDNLFQTSIYGGYGNYHSIRMGANINGPIVNDQFYMGVSILYRTSDGYVTNEFNGDDNAADTNQKNGRGTLRWTPTNRWDISLMADVMEADDHCGQYRYVTGPYATPAHKTNKDEANEYLKENGNSQTLQVKYGGDVVDIKSITGILYRWREKLNDSDLTANPKNPTTNLNRYDLHQYSQEVHFSSVREGPFQWLGGLYGFSEDTHMDHKNEYTSNGKILKHPVADVATKGYAVFGQGTYSVFGRLHLTAGLRFDHQDLEGDFKDAARNVTCHDDLRYNEILPKFSAAYDLSDTAMVYASAGKGYMTGGFNVFADPIQNTFTYDPEYTWNYEIGAKSTWFEGKLMANLSLFYIDIDDKQVMGMNPETYEYRITNATGAHSQGLELQIQTTPVQGLNLFGGFGYADARFDDYKSFDWNADYTQRVLNNFEGNALPYAPRYTYNLGAHYRTPIGIYVRAELFGTDGFYGEAANLSEQKAYELVSARCGYEWKGVDLCLWMENVFDTEYLTTIKWKKSGIVGLDGPPRSLGVQLTWRY